MILPYTCDVEHIHKASALLKSVQDYNALMDINLINWGNPNKGKGWLAMPYYIGSTIVGEDLSKLKKSKALQTFLTTTSLIYFHTTNIKQNLNLWRFFFSGKSPIHTWRQDLQQRFKEYLDCYLTDPNTVNNIFGEDT